MILIVKDLGKFEISDDDITSGFRCFAIFQRFQFCNESVLSSLMSLNWADSKRRVL